MIGILFHNEFSPIAGNLVMDYNKGVSKHRNLLIKNFRPL